MAPTPLIPGRPIGLLVKIFPKLSETFVLEEVLGLERLGVALKLYTLAAPTDALAHPAVQRVQAGITQVPAAPWRAGWRFVQLQLGLLAASPTRYARAFAAACRRGRPGLVDFTRAGWLARRLQDDGVPHLHTHFISSPADVAELVALVSGLPFSISAHAKDIYLGRPADLRRKMAAARFTVTCTDANCRALRGIAPDAAVHRMYHGIDGSVFHPARRIASAQQPALVPLILSVGRLREKKGLDTLVEACRLLAGRGIAFRCQIVGYGEEHHRLAALIDRHGLASQVQLTGKLARDAVIACYARAAVYVQPSRIAADGDRDGIPNVLLEAMAMAVPVVATRVSGIPEVVRHGHNGWLVEPDDPAALADAIARVIDTPDEATALGQRARATVTDQFDNDRNLRLVLQLLEPAHGHATSCAVA